MEGVGFAAGYLPLPDRLRVREVLAYFANLHGVADPGPAIDAGLERFRIPHLADAMASELSSGQRTLVGHHQGHAAPAPAAGPRRADRLTRPRRRPPGARSAWRRPATPTARRCS